MPQQVAVVHEDADVDGPEVHPQPHLRAFRALDVRKMSRLGSETTKKQGEGRFAAGSLRTGRCSLQGSEACLEDPRDRFRLPNGRRTQVPPNTGKDGESNANLMPRIPFGGGRNFEAAGQRRGRNRWLEKGRFSQKRKAGREGGGKG